MERLTMNISGMSCGHCVRAVTSALQELDTVQVQSVGLGSAAVTYDPNATSPEQIAQAIEEAGYMATPVGQGTRSGQ